MKQIVIHPDADAEITEASQFYEARNSGLGWDFLGELERAFDQIAAPPLTSPRIGKRVRCKILWRFPYNVIYAVYPDRIRIVACAHRQTETFLLAKTAAGIKLQIDLPAVSPPDFHYYAVTPGY